MKSLLLLTITIPALVGLLSCSNPASDETSLVTATETWHLAVPQEVSSADIVLEKHEDNTITVSGDWTYEFFGNMITCTIMTGTVSRDTSRLIFNCSGTASYPPDSTGYKESSPFTLSLTGTFQSGSASGSWEIAFSDEVWNEWAPEGVFTGARESGSGVTQ